MELVEGDTLQQRLEKGRLPLDRALEYATQIADALDKAHRQGVVHRDLKPGNIMITKSAGVKLLDFGLAKLKGDDAQVSPLSQMPTQDPSAPLTAEGTIIGTLQYMAPEQLEGKEADARTDIFAFGAVVYEMVTGKKAFEGASQASLIGAIMNSQPPSISTPEAMTPPALDHVVRTALTKDPDDRWQTTHDLMAQLRWIAEVGTEIGIPAPVAIGRRRKERLSTILLGVATLLLIATSVPAVLYFRGPEPPTQVRFLVDVPNTTASSRANVVISPDGNRIAYVALTPAGTTALFIRPIGSVSSQQLSGTERAGSPFWSPDSRQLAFVAEGRLKKIDVGGGSPQDICELTGLGGFASGTWNAEGTIIFSSLLSRLHRVSDAGGEPVPITALDESRQEIGHSWPSFLPDNRHFLFTAYGAEPAVRLGSLDSSDTTHVMTGRSMAMYAEPGYLLYDRQATLFAQPFDVENMELGGEAIRIAEVFSNLGGAAFGVSRNGTLIYRGGETGASHAEFVWFDRMGKRLDTAGEPGPYESALKLSPDGQRLAVSINEDIWLMDWTRGINERFTHDPAREGDVVWSPDGTQLAFTSFRSGSGDIFVKDASGLGEATLLVGTPAAEFLEDWSNDGRYIVYKSTADQDYYAIPLLEEPREPFRVIQSPFNLDEVEFSPDSEWLAYNSDDSGSHQVYVISFPAADQRRQISTEGGAAPRWRSDGRELYYLALDGKMMAVDIELGESIGSGIPRVLFETGLTTLYNLDQYDVTPDGEQFIVRVPLTEDTPTPITVVLNWAVELNEE